MRNLALACILGCLAVVLTVPAMAQPSQFTVTVREVLADPPKFVNRDLILVGEIRNPQETEAGRGTYDLSDSSEAAITVRTLDLPAPGGTWEVSGQVRIDSSTSLPYFYESSRHRPGLGTWMIVLIAGGVVLVVLLVVLVIMLTKPAPKQQAHVAAPGGRRGDTEVIAAPGAEAGPPGVVPAPIIAPAAPPGETQVFYGATLRVVEGPDTGKSHRVVAPQTSLGRGGDFDLMDPTVSRPHASLTAPPNGGLLLVNLSKHGTRVNGEPMNSTQLKDKDRIQIGGTVIEVSMPAAPAAAEAPAAGAVSAGDSETMEMRVPDADGNTDEAGVSATQEFLGAQLEVISGPHQGDVHVFTQRVTTIGRQDGNDFVLGKDPTVSRKHGEVRHADGQFVIMPIEDKQVLVNGEPQEMATLRTGDEIQMGATKMRFESLK